LSFVFYSLPISESTDATDTAQLAIFFYGVEDFKIMEELAALGPAKETTEATDLYETLKNDLNTCQLKIKNISALTTDIASAPVGNRRGVAAMIKKIQMYTGTVI
jgi:hypothetical protein